MKIKSGSGNPECHHTLLLCNSEKELNIPELFKKFFTSEHRDSLKKNNSVIVTVGEHRLGIYFCTHKEPKNYEKLRRFVSSFYSRSLKGNYAIVPSEKTEQKWIEEAALAFLLSSYSFTKFKKENKDKKEKFLFVSGLEANKIQKIETLADSVFLARDWVNTPVNHLNAPKLAEEFKALSKKAPLKVTVYDKKDIIKLGMGGLLSVNQGSVDEPRFTIMEYHPKNKRNKKPLVLVGKGLVYDTGGLSLKPTPGSMDSMKCDMAGGAVVAATIFAVARLKLPVHVIALIPSTDNRPGFNAFAPGDIIKMMDGTWVEMLNSDAEGRMILADALHYAKRLHPELVLEFSTLTGAAANAIGHYAMVGMGEVSPEQRNKIFQSAERTGERIAEFPFWDDYDELLKSDIADCKNIGGPVAGAITAGRFLKKFTDYPYYHFDIAGPAFIQKPFHYMPAGGTGFGIRFLMDFIENY